MKNKGTSGQKSLVILMIVVLLIVVAINWKFG
jgi:hypothetical protein